MTKFNYIFSRKQKKSNTIAQMQTERVRALDEHETNNFKIVSNNLNAEEDNYFVCVFFDISLEIIYEIFICRTLASRVISTRTDSADTISRLVSSTVCDSMHLLRCMSVSRLVDHLI